jgi:hypothetical protein
MIHSLERLFHASLRFFPPNFRRTYADEMQEIFSERIRGVSPARACAIALDEVVDAVAAGTRARLGRSPQLRPALVGGVGAIVVATIIAMPGSGLRPRIAATSPTDSIDFNAEDPAGQFTLSIRKGHPVAATIDHVALPMNRVLHSGDSIRFLGPSGRVVLAVAYYRERARIEWEARPRFCHGRASECPVYQ